MFPTGNAIVLIQAGYDIAFRCKAATPMLLQVHLRSELRARLKTPEAFRLDPVVPFRTYTDDFGNICTRLVAPAGVLKLSNRFVIRDKGTPERLPLKARQAKVEDLPDEVLVYLLGSRYCDTDVWIFFVIAGACGNCSIRDNRIGRLGDAKCRSLCLAIFYYAGVCV